MLSKIVKGEEVQKLEYEPYALPTREDIHEILSEKKRSADRATLIEDHKEDPVKAAKKEANKILIEAQEKLKEAEVEANVLKNRKEKEMRTKLEKEFQTRLEAEVNKIQQNYLNAMEELATLKEMIYKKSEHQLMQMVFAVSRKVIGDEIKASPDIVVSMLKKGFERIKEVKEVELKVNPVDYDTIASRKGDMQEILKTTGTIKITRDDQVERGGCQIITDQGEISSEPGKQLDIIMRELSDGA